MRPRRSRSASSTPPPGSAILCTSQVPLDVDGEALFELTPLALSDAVELFTRRASSRARERSGQRALTTRCSELCRSLDGLPLAIELAAARTKTLSIEEITRRLDDRFNVLRDPTSRRPERRRALKATIGWSYELLFPDDQRGLWALATFAGGAPLPAVEFVLEALDVPASAAIDVVGRLASRSLVIVDDEDASAAVRYRLLDSIRAFALEAMTDARSDRARPRRARAMVRGRRRIVDSKVCAATAKPNTSRSPAPSAPTSTPHWRGAPRTSHCVAVDIVNGFGWAWVVLGDSRGAQRILAALDAAGDAASDQDRAERPVARGVDRSVDGSSRARPRPHRGGDRAGGRDQRRRPASALQLLPRLRRVASRRVRTGAGAHRSRSTRSTTGSDRPWDQARELALRRPGRDLRR